MSWRHHLAIAAIAAALLGIADETCGRGFGKSYSSHPLGITNIGQIYHSGPFGLGGGFSFPRYVHNRVITDAFRGEFQGASSKGGFRGQVAPRSFSPDGGISAGGTTAAGGFRTVGPVTYGGARVTGPTVIGGGAPRFGAGGFGGGVGGAGDMPGYGGGAVAGLPTGGGAALRGGRGFSGGQLTGLSGLPSDAGIPAPAGGTGLPVGPGSGSTALETRHLYPSSTAKVRANAKTVRGSFQAYDLFTLAWYTATPSAWRANRIATDNVWHTADWMAVSKWLGYIGTTPVLLDYGVNVVYDGDKVRVRGKDAGTAEEYYQQAAAIAAGSSGQHAPSDKQSWLPLGVFVMAQPDQTTASIVFQLALDKSGAIRGNSTSTATHHTLAVQGSVDKESQRVAWTVGDNQTIVFETGLFNLTKDHAPALVHYGKGRTEQLLFVQLQRKANDHR